ncbi:hypothetical protein CCUS01_02807, partial [Colletotrichum cuscutae]
DVDNCLYPDQSGVQKAASILIDKFFQNHLGLSEGEATRLHQKYLEDYDLIVEGLITHHAIDPMVFNEMVEGAIPLESLIEANPNLRRLLQDIDTSQVRLWIFSNAYITHVEKVLRLLNIKEFFDGIIYCDPANVPIVCKPQAKMYAEAMKAAGVHSTAKCFLIDDSYNNCRGAQEFGWTATHLIEEGHPCPQSPAAQHRIRSLEDIRTLFPSWFTADPSEL